MKWHVRFFNLAHVAATWSKDEGNQVGALVVAPNRRLVSPGYNGFPPGIADTEERLTNKEVKLQLMVHAEINAMNNAGQSIEGWTMYVTRPCCNMCALQMISRGIKEVYMPELDPQSTWYQVQQLAVGLLAEAKIPTYFLSEKNNG